MVKKSNDIELLAPAGNLESLYAAVENGASAVYLGGKDFSARQYANNFSEEDIKKAVEYAHLRNAKVYITINILLDNDEIKKALYYIKKLYEIDVDGLIVQDLGLAKLLRNIFPDMDIHGSTQMTINNLYGAIFLQEMGFERVVLARELSVDEIKHISKNSDIGIEVFIHGALCVCYSGQCLMSSIIGGRSGNRGRCAQPCRLPYTIVEYNTGRVISKELENKYILSHKDLNTMNFLKDIINAGAVSLKIEGRMKKPEYVALVVSKYRKYLSEIEKSKEVQVSEQDNKELFEIFNRGFTKGYILGDYGESMISLDRPDNRGICIGKVIKSNRNQIDIKLFDNVFKNDGIEIWSGNTKSIGIVLNDEGRKGDILSIEGVKGVKTGDLVYKTLNFNLIKKAKESYKDKKNKIGIYIKVKVKIGRPIELDIVCEDKHIEVKSNEIVEKGLKVAITKDRIVEQMDRLNDTPYYIKDINVELEKGAYIPIKVLNEIRRNGVELLNEKRKFLNNRIIIKEKDFNDKIEEELKLPIADNKKHKKMISIKIRNINQFKELNLNKVDRIYFDFDQGLRDCIKEAKKYNIETFISTNKIINNDEFINLENKINNIQSDIDGISVSNIGTLYFIKENYHIPIHGDMGLNIFNNYTIKTLKENNISSVTLSPELRLNQIKNMTKYDLAMYEALGYGYLQLMVTKYCPFSLIKGCKNAKNCTICPYANGYGLKDRLGKVFYTERNGENTTIYNSQPLMVLEELDRLYNSGIDMIRLDFTFEEGDIITNIQESYFDYANGNISFDEVKKIVNSYRKDIDITKGHYFRGVL